MKQVNDLVKDVFGDYTGYAVEAGAFDGIFESTTNGLEQLGWKVLLIEPIPTAFKALLKNRCNDYCLQYALGSIEIDDVDFTVYDNYNGASISSLNPSEKILTNFNPYDTIPKEVIKVDVKTLDTCLDIVEFPRLDILSLDVEGSELDVFHGFNFDKWKPELLIIENIFQDESIYNYLYDYELIDRFIYNEIFLRKN